MQAFYWICLFATILFLLWYVNVGERYSIHQNMLVLIVAVANGGYLAMIYARDLREAILANKIMYLIGCFGPMLVFLVVCEICKLKVKNWNIMVMYLIQFVLYAAVCSIGYSPLYYESVAFEVVNGIGYLSKTYGVLHILYPVTMYTYLFASIIVAVVSAFRGTEVSRKTVIATLIGFVTIVAGYVGERIAGLQFEIIPGLFLIDVILVLVPWRKLNAYSISENVCRVYEKEGARGFVLFDNKLRFMGSNACAKNLFPELQYFNLDSKVPQRESVFVNHVIPLLTRYAETGKTDTVIINVGNSRQEISISDIARNGGRSVGYLIEIIDVTEHQEYLDMVNNYNRNLESEVLGKTQKIKEIQEKTLLGMAQMVESRDLSTGGHIKRTSSVVRIFVKEIQKEMPDIDSEFLYLVIQSAPMHDLGKITVDDQILRKQGKFTDEEYAIMKTHAAAGAKIVRDILIGIEDARFVEVATNVAHYHHERVDGTGYPEQLRGDMIPLEARIMALADVFDALVSRRCYKEGFTFDKAFAIIEESAGKHFDERLARIFIKCRPQLEMLYRSFEDA